MRSLSLLFCLMLGTLLAACQSVADKCATAPNPTECAKVVDAGGKVDDYLLYGMAGYMLSSAINGSGQRQSVLIPDPSYRGYRPHVPTYAASRAYVRSRTVTTTTTRPGPFGGSRTTTSVTRFSSRPSFSTSSYRSSFRSSGFRSFRR